ncbi:MAG: S8 family serine peptidase [bacterium]|nr:S8 family serine peptidase [bacterium]
MHFVEVPGDMEFTGVMLARPLQPEHASERGLTTAQLNTRASAARNDLGAFEVTRYVVETDEYLFLVPEGETENTVANRLLATGNFQYVEPDWLVFPIACPNDAQFSQQWHHEANRMQSCDAWDIETGDPSIVVAICDTGVRVTHQDLLLHRNEGFHAPSNTWESAGGSINDINGHGTNCTGTSAANGNNGTGVAGVGWNLGHRMMRVTDSSGGSASLSNLTLAARTAADAGDKVASVSYSGVSSGGVDTAGAYVRSRGALLIWAAGNASSNLTGNRDDNVIVVGATTSSDNLAGFSNFGPLVDLTAPGSGIRTTSNSSDSSYANVSGTSFACPMVAGLCGLIWSRNPLLSPQEVENILRNSCDDLGPSGIDDTFGYGRINSFEAMLDTPPPTVSISFPNGLPEIIDPAGGTTVQVLVVPGNDSPFPGAEQFLVDTGSGYQLAPMSLIGTNLYEATFPAAACPSDVAYYFNFPLNGGGAATAPQGAPAESYSTVAEIRTTLFTDDLESASGWTVGAAGDSATTGVWVRNNPIGTAAQVEDDHSNPGTNCFFTGQGSPGGSVGENDVDGGATTLLSPTLDMSIFPDPHISYWRSYSNNAGSTVDDVFVVEISNNGGTTWSNVETIGPNGPDATAGWRQNTFNVASILPPTANMRLRFIASDNGGGSIVEAAIDDLEVFELCNACGAANYCPANDNSLGIPAEITFGGSTSFSSNDLTLVVSACPPNENGLFIYSPDQATLPIGDGVLCIGATTLGFFVRLPVVTTDNLGSAAFAYDNTAPPIPPGQVAAGETWNFQFWYRDNGSAGAGFNLSNGLSITFCP